MSTQQKFEGGGPAFPHEEKCEASGQHYQTHHGMTQRDYFAGQALSGMCANVAWDDTFHPKNYPLTAQTAYALADAMLAERAKRREA